MSLFWILAAFLTIAVVAVLARPLLRGTGAQHPAGSDLAVYRDQLAELGRDRARGVVDAGEAASLEAEIGRRMLGAARNGEPEFAPARPARKLTLLLAATVPIGALVIYLAVGQPELPAQPLAERQIAPNSDPAKILAEIEHVRAGLKPVKDDLNNWVIVAEAFAKLGRPRDAAEAFRVAAGIDPDDTQLRAALAENLIMADGGAVGQEARTILAAIPAGSPAQPEARFYLALADFQGGNIKGALAGWQSLLADSPADAGWIEPTRARIAEAAQSLGLDPAKETPAPKTPAARSAETPDAAAIEQMSPEDQRAMVQNMVASLAAKLQAQPDNPAGWRQLARAYRVLGEEDKAKEALDRATRAEAKAPAKP